MLYKRFVMLRLVTATVKNFAQESYWKGIFLAARVKRKLEKLELDRAVDEHISKIKKDNQRMNEVENKQAKLRRLNATYFWILHVSGPCSGDRWPITKQISWIYTDLELADMLHMLEEYVLII